MDILPNDIWSIILSFLELDDYESILTVSEKFRKLVYNYATFPNPLLISNGKVIKNESLVSYDHNLLTSIIQSHYKYKIIFPADYRRYSINIHFLHHIAKHGEEKYYKINVDESKYDIIPIKISTTLFNNKNIDFITIRCAFHKKKKYRTRQWTFKDLYNLIENDVGHNIVDQKIKELRMYNDLYNR